MGSRARSRVNFSLGFIQAIETKHGTSSLVLSHYLDEKERILVETLLSCWRFHRVSDQYNILWQLVANTSRSIQTLYSLSM